jgi:hydroxypyruvate isomerase
MAVMKPIRLATNFSLMFQELMPEQRYAAAACAGFRGVEEMEPYRWMKEHLASMLADNDLAMVQIMTPMNLKGGEIGYACHPGREAEFRAGAERALEYAQALGKPLVHVGLGLVPPETDARRCYDVLVQNLAWLAAAADSQDLLVMFEPIATIRIPRYILHSLEQGAQLIRDVNRTNLKLVFDVFHVQLEEGNIINAMDKYWPLIAHFQFANPPGRRGPDEGELDLHFYLRAIAERGWNGWVAAEYLPSTPNTVDSLGWARRYGVVPREPA